jgi:hypothetical protein
MPSSSVPSGAHGVLVRELQLKDSLSQPLTPEEMWRQAVQSQRGFRSSSNGGTDALRTQPSTVPPGLGGSKNIGMPVGKGFETFASIQIVGSEGRRLALGSEFFNGGGPEEHGEARTIRGLVQNGPAKVKGGRMMVVVEKEPCPYCDARLREYARARGLTAIEIYVPERESMLRPGQMVTPKTAARTSFQGGRPPTSLKKLPTIQIERDPATPALPDVEGPNVRTAVVGAVANLAAGVLLGIVQTKFKEETIKSLENMPKPQIDRRAAGDYFKDPNTVKGIRAIDLLNKNMAAFIEQLDQHHRKIVGETTVELMLMTLSHLPDGERLKFLSGLTAELQIFSEGLDVIRDNVAAAKLLQPRAIEAAEAAEGLVGTIDNGAVFQYLFQMGFHPFEIVDIQNNLRNYGSCVRQVFQNLNALSVKVESFKVAQVQLLSQVNTLTWRLALSRFAAGSNRP